MNENADTTLHQLLDKLRRAINAQTVLLARADGFPVEVSGQNKGMDIVTIASLVAANFLTSTELAHLVGSNAERFKSSYQEGTTRNIYSYKVNADFILMVISDVNSKAGAIWFYTKKTCKEVRNHLANHSSLLEQRSLNDLRETLKSDTFVSDLDSMLDSLQV